MTISSKFSAKGLSLRVSIPLVQGDSVIGNYSDIVNDYSHVTSASGGYLSSSFSMAGNNEFIEDWLQNGLGRDIKVFNPQLNTIWEGFVNQVDINMGGATFSRGPLTNLANRVSAVYIPIIDGDVDPPITGTATETTIGEDLDSQYKYGIWEKLLNIGTVTLSDAYFIQDLYLAENSYPDGNPSLSISGSGELNVSISCRGYIDFLDYIYNYITDHISIYLSEVIKNILGDDPNDVISTFYDRIEENLYIKDPWTEDNKTAKTLIDEVLAYGGGNDDRWTFGIYKDRKAIYEAIPTDVEYIYYKTGITQQVESINGSIIEPWDVLPCKWVAIPTFLSSMGIKIEDMRNDPRIFFAEEVNFTAPDQVNISGAKVSKLNQYMAKLGLGNL
jgi:hypothetical protein